MRAIRSALILVAAMALAATGGPGAAAGGGSEPSQWSQGPAQSAAGLDRAVASGRLDRHVADAIRHGAVDAIVSFRGDAALGNAVARAPAGNGRSVAIVSRASRAYAALKHAALSAVPGVRLLRDYDVLPLAFVRIPSASALRALLARPEVAGVEANMHLQPTLAESLPLIRQPQAAAAGDTGSGASVAVLDTGVDYTRSAFGSCSAPGPSCKVVYAHDFATDDGVLDDDGHGTNVAGIVVGVAPGAKVEALDVFGPGGSASGSDILAAVNWAVANQSTYNIRAINMSLGAAKQYFSSESACASASNTFVAPFANARAVGILPVVAAGNDAYQSFVFHDGVSWPACTAGAERVGAVYDSDSVPDGITWGANGDCTDDVTNQDQITCFSQTGTLLSVLAPGAMIIAAGIEEGGTSQATPHVAGAVAVLAAHNPSATAAQIQTAINGAGPTITDPRNGITRHRLDLPDAVAAVGGGGGSPVLTVTIAGSGTGTVTSSPAGISCPPTCQAPFTSGQSVTLSATPNSGATFDGWSGSGCTGTGTCTVTMDASKGVTANFGGTGGSFTLTVQKSGSGSGTITTLDGQISCGSTCSHGYASGSSVTIHAAPASGSSFTGFSGGGCSGTSDCTVTMNANTTVTATFATAGHAFRPDLRIKFGSNAYIGNNVYNTTGTNQTISVHGGRPSKGTFSIILQNDGTSIDRIDLTGPGNSGGLKLVYSSGGTVFRTPLNVYVDNFDPGHVTVPIKIVLTITKSAIVGMHTLTFRAVSSGDHSVDVVKIKVRVLA